MMSIILSIALVLVMFVMGLTPILCHFTTNNLIHLFAITTLYCVWFFSFVSMLLTCINCVLAKIERYQMRDEVKDEVKGTVTKREAKKGLFNNSYKVTISYEGMSVTTDSYALYQTCREGDSINVILRTRLNLQHHSRYLSLD